MKCSKYMILLTAQERDFIIGLLDDHAKKVQKDGGMIPDVVRDLELRSVSELRARLQIPAVSSCDYEENLKDDEKR